VYKSGQREWAGRAYALISLPWRGSSPAPDTGTTVNMVPVSALPRNLDESILTGNGLGSNKASGPSLPFALRLSSFPRSQNPPRGSPPSLLHDQTKPSARSRLGARLYRFFPLRMGFNTAWSLRQIVPTQNSRTCECWWRYFPGTRIAQTVLPVLP
jgi:hypothetical protein